MTSPPTVVFIHGMYMNGVSWQPWVERAADLGYVCHAPSWPYHEGDPGWLRDNVDPALGRLTFAAVTEHLRRFIDSLPEPPALIGHSIGGLAVQKLINGGYGTAGVAISSAPARWVLSGDPRFVRANFPHLNPAAGNAPVVMTPSRFHYTFANTMSAGASRRLFDRYVVPESRNVPRSILTSQGQIDFRRSHAPLLFLAGDRDHLTPLAMVRRNAHAYRRSPAAVDLVQFPGRSHGICNQDGWQEVADTAFDWLARQR